MRWFIGCVFLFVGHQFSQYFGYDWTLVDAYLDPFLFFPIVLFTAKSWNQVYNKSYRVGLMLGLLTLLVLSLLFEFVFPMLSKQFESDSVDVVFYFSGFMFYMILMND